ncbi:DUF72 domain-containing protein [Thermocrinis sp.]
MKVYVGCSGFYYKDWVGVFYPPSLKRQEWIKYYEKFFNVLELNSSFYRFPDRRSVKSLLERTNRLRFSLKAHQVFTHRRTFSQEDVKRFIYSVEPILKEDRFIAILFQFPHNFGYSAENLEYIKKIAKEFRGLEKVVEVRNKSFRRADFYQFLEENGFSIVNSDAPKGEKFLIGPWVGVGSINYLRLHGRDPEHPYDYLYSFEELRKLKSKIKELGDRETYIFFNNTAMAKAVLNALQTKLLFGIEVEIPDSLQSAFEEREWE